MTTSDATHENYDSTEARKAYDSITGGSYYAMQFYTCLRTDPEAFAAAVKLGERLRANGVKGA